MTDDAAARARIEAALRAVPRHWHTDPECFSVEKRRWYCEKREDEPDYPAMAAAVATFAASERTRAHAPSGVTALYGLTLDDIGRIMHESWCVTKRRQGFHGARDGCTEHKPYLCDESARCRWFHADLTAWENLPERQKEINRHAFDAVLAEINRRALEAVAAQPRDIEGAASEASAAREEVERLRAQLNANCLERDALTLKLGAARQEAEEALTRVSAALGYTNAMSVEVIERAIAGLRAESAALGAAQEALRLALLALEVRAAECAALSANPTSPP